MEFEVAEEQLRRLPTEPGTQNQQPTRVS